MIFSRAQSAFFFWKMEKLTKIEKFGALLFLKKTKKKLGASVDVPSPGEF